MIRRMMLGKMTLNCAALTKNFRNSVKKFWIGSVSVTFARITISRMTLNFAA